MATNATLHDVHPRTVAASVSVQDVSKYVCHSYPICAISGRKQHTCLLIVCRVHDTKVAVLDNVVALKLDLPTVGVGGCYVPEKNVNYCL